nr:MAG TPA: hypothetical protein [Caudoviricetes sp.]
MRYTHDLAHLNTSFMISYIETLLAAPISFD